MSDENETVGQLSDVDDNAIDSLISNTGICSRKRTIPASDIVVAKRLRSASEHQLADGKDTPFTPLVFSPDIQKCFKKDSFSHFQV